MRNRSTLFPAIAAAVMAISPTAPSVFAAEAPAPTVDSGVVRVRSHYSVEDTVKRLQADIAEKGIQYFDTIDHQNLAKGAGITLKPSKLLLFGNPPLGIQFIEESPYAGLDWPVRMLVFEDADGAVWVAYTDFGYIGKRHHLTMRDAQLKMASEVAASIASSVSK